jgi:hypothetical protein
MMRAEKHTVSNKREPVVIMAPVGPLVNTKSNAANVLEMNHVLGEVVQCVRWMCID